MKRFFSMLLCLSACACLFSCLHRISTSNAIVYGFPETVKPGYEIFVVANAESNRFILLKRDYKGALSIDEDDWQKVSPEDGKVHFWNGAAEFDLQTLVFEYYDTSYISDDCEDVSLTLDNGMPCRITLGGTLKEVNSRTEEKAVAFKVNEDLQPGCDFYIVKNGTQNKFAVMKTDDGGNASFLSVWSKLEIDGSVWLWLGNRRYSYNPVDMKIKDGDSEYECTARDDVSFSMRSGFPAQVKIGSSAVKDVLVHNSVLYQADDNYGAVIWDAMNDRYTAVIYDISSQVIDEKALMLYAKDGSVNEFEKADEAGKVVFPKTKYSSLAEDLTYTVSSRSLAAGAATHSMSVEKCCNLEFLKSCDLVSSIFCDGEMNIYLNEENVLVTKCTDSLDYNGTANHFNGQILYQYFLAHPSGKYSGFVLTGLGEYTSNIDMQIPSDGYIPFSIGATPVAMRFYPADKSFIDDDTITGDPESPLVQCIEPFGGNAVYKWNADEAKFDMFAAAFDGKIYYQSI